MKFQLTIGTTIYILLYFCCIYVTVGQDVKKAGDDDDSKQLNLESIKDLVNAKPGDRKLSHCLLHLAKQNCNINITSSILPCPILKLTEHLFSNIDITKITGNFINPQLSLVNIKFEFDMQGTLCSPTQGKVELNMNSTGHHIRMVNSKYLPLKVISLQASWTLGLEVLRSIDLDIHGVFISDNLGGSTNIPRYEGIIIEIDKPKELTIFEFKTTKAKAIQLKHFLKDFNIETDSIITELAEKTKSELSLNTLMLSEAQLIGYIEPNIIFEFQLTGHHSGSNAFENANNLYITVQKYHNQFEPAVAIFGKFTGSSKLRVDLELLKLTGLNEIPNLSFLKDILSYGLVLATHKFSVINIKEARDAANDFYCSECGARYLQGFYLIFNVFDDLHFVQSVTNDTKSDKKIIIPKSPVDDKNNSQTLSQSLSNTTKTLSDQHKRGSITHQHSAYHGNNNVKLNSNRHNVVQTNIPKNHHGNNHVRNYNYYSNFIPRYPKNNFDSYNQMYYANPYYNYQNPLKRSEISSVHHQFKRNHKHANIPTKGRKNERRKHRKVKRIKRDDELKDILNSLNPGNLTINDTVPGAFDLDDTFVLDNSLQAEDTPKTPEDTPKTVDDSTISSNDTNLNINKTVVKTSINSSTSDVKLTNETMKIDSNDVENKTTSFGNTTSETTEITNIITTDSPPISPTTPSTTTPKITPSPSIQILPPKAEEKITPEKTPAQNATETTKINNGVSSIFQNEKNFKFPTNNDRIIIFANIQEKSIVFALPQNMEGDLGDVKRFVSTSLKNNEKCTPFKNITVKYNLDRMILTNEKLEIILNITSPIKLVPNLLTINRFTGITYTIVKAIDGKFDFNNVAISGDGKQTVLDEEINLSITQDNEACSIIGQLHLTSIGNITTKFNTELLAPDTNKLFPTIDKIPIQKIYLKTSLNGEKTIRLFGTSQLIHGIYLKMEAQIWSRDKERRMELALIATDVELAKFMNVIYNDENVVYSWLAMEKTAILISGGLKSDIQFEDELLNQIAVKEPGVTFVGKLGHSTNCEVHLSNDVFCQYFHTKLAITQGLHIEGILKHDKFSLIGNLNSFITITKEVILVEPSLIISYDEKWVDAYLSGLVAINIRNEEVKIKGKLSRHGSGFVSLQIASPSNNHVFNNTFMQFKPLYGFTHLWKKNEEQLNFELQGSHIGIGIQNSDKLLHIINSAGRVIPSNTRQSYFYGVIKDLTYPKLLDTFGLSSKVRQVPFLVEARFLGITKVFYSEGEKEQKFHFFNELIKPGLSLYGDMKISGSTYKTILRIEEGSGLKLNIEFPILSLAKEMVIIRKTKEEESLGAILTYTIPLNPKQRIIASMRAYVSAIGMEKEEIEIKVEQKTDSSLYFLYQLKGKLFGELEMVVNYRGTEKINEGMKMIGRCPNVQSLKKPIELHLRRQIHDFIQIYNEQYRLNDRTMKDMQSLMRDLGTSGEESVRGRLKDLLIQLEENEQNIKEHLMGIEQDCVEKCSKKPIEIQTLQDQTINDGSLKTLSMQRITPRWAINVSCVAVCEVDKGVSYKKACEKLIVIRNLYPLYEKQHKRALKLDRYLQVARKMKEVADKADEAFVKDSTIAKQTIDRYFEESIASEWFELLDVMLPETDVGSLKGKLPCLKMKIKFKLYGETKEMTKGICVNGEALDNIAKEIFKTMITKTQMKDLIDSYDQLKSTYSRVTQHRSELLNVIKVSDIDEDIDSSSIETLSKRDELFKPLLGNKVNKKEEDLYDRRFRKLAHTEIPQYTVHSYKTSVVMNQKSPWAMLKASKNQARTSTVRNQINGTVPEENDCNTVNTVASKYSHLTNALTDLVEAYEDGKTSFSTARDELVDSLHSLDSKITNEANRTYYTKGELKDMIYWSVRVWKGVEEWVQETTRQFEDHNRNAISLFTEQLDGALSTERIPNAADYIQYLSHVGSSAIRKMDIERAVSVVKKTDSTDQLKSETTDLLKSETTDLLKPETDIKNSDPIKDDLAMKKSKVAKWDKRGKVPIERTKQKKRADVRKRMLPSSSDSNYILKRSQVQKRKKTKKTYKKSVIEENDNVIVKKDLSINDLTSNLFDKKDSDDKTSKKSSGLVYRQIDHVQNVAIALSTFLRNKDMTLDEAATRIPALRNEVRALESKVSTCDTPV